MAVVPQREMKPGTRRLSEVARIVSQPSGIVSTGWGDVERVSQDLGITYDEWQRGLGRISLARRADGLLATTVGGVGASLPRQVGKTFFVSGLTFSLCILRPGLLVLWTAQHLKTSGETFLAMQAFAQRPEVAPYVERVYTGSGDEEVRFKNGSRILFGARERGFGRGIPGVDAIIFDEAQIMSDRALDAMLATMNTSDLGLHFYIGTPPRPEDLSESFTSMREQAWAGTLEDAAWIECGADPGADPDDQRQWAKANPSYPHRTPLQAFLRLRAKLKPDSFLREGLGVWPDAAGGGEAAIDVGQWRECSIPAEMVAEEWRLAAIGLDADPVDGRLFVSVAAHAGDSGVHVELLPDGAVPRDTDALVDWVWRRARKRRPVVIPADSPAMVLQAPLLARGCKVYPLNHRERVQASTGLEVAVREGTVSHLDDPLLEQGVLESERERSKSAPGQWQLKRSGEVGAAPLYAVACAAYGAVRWSQRSSVSTSKRGGVCIL